MTDYVITNGRSSAYPLNHYGAQFTGSRATFCLDADLVSGLDANTQAIPGLSVSALTSSIITVPDTFFGAHVYSRSNDALVGVTAKTIRSHDMENGKGRWQFIQPTATTWDWADLDSWVNAHYAAGRDLVFTLYGTPSWASARSTERNAYSDQPGDSSQYNRGIAAEPADLTKWDAYCTAVAQRYLGKIKYYEVWNEPNWHNDGTGPGTNTDCYFTGTFAVLAQMVRRANQAIKAVDPTAKIICPPLTAWVATAGGTAETYFTGMMSASDGATGIMKNWIDVVGVHLYIAGNDTSKMSGMIDRVKAAMTTAGISGKEIWDTESSPIAPDLTSMLDVRAQAIIGRSMIIQAAKGISRTIYYQYDNSSTGIINRPSIWAYREAACSSLKNSVVLNAYNFTDGRVAYSTSTGVSVI